MSDPPPNLVVADSFMAYKAREHPYIFAKGGISFFAFLLSILIYISIFYIFNLSFSALFNNNKFWFCISNTLILIIAADCGAFSPSKQRVDFYDHYEDYMLKQTQIKYINASPLSSLNLDYNPRKVSIPKQEKEIVVDQERENPEKLQIITEECDSHPSSEHIQQKKDGEQINIPARTYRRSKSEKAKRTVLDESRITVRRSETIKKEVNKEENEFSRMTDEELNRRVEEFIQRFNRQIRLQAAATKTNQN